MPPDGRLPKEDTLLVRLDPEMAAKVRHKARRYGGASAVIRALLRRWLEQDIVTAADVLAETQRAQERRPRHTPRKPAKD